MTKGAIARWSRPSEQLSALLGVLALLGLTRLREALGETLDVAVEVLPSAREFDGSSQSRV
ncbi:hypothetical protein M3697_16985 [Janibacter melonis]|uniref:hypothetical protein n=1 Tax=Janibacter melonis TaxID=262209 RepID=UPI0020437099|nr:hypothetical protein [Janibacter melonis]MCM3556782.1 hypothetical protein [Janibacter melonis]